MRHLLLFKNLKGTITNGDLELAGSISEHYTESKLLIYGRRLLTTLIVTLLMSTGNKKVQQQHLALQL